MIAIPGDRSSSKQDTSHSDPTPEEIRQRAAAIRAHWNAQTRKRRSVQAEPTPWLPPGVNMDDVSENIRQTDNN